MKLGAINNFAGTEVSLNLKKASYWGLGDDKRGKVFWLSSESWSGVIPDDVSSEDAAKIASAFASGTLVMGREWIPALDKDKTVLRKYEQVLNDHKYITDEFKDTWRDLLNRKNVGNYTAREIISHCITLERKLRNRKPQIEWLEAALDYYEGPDFLVQDFPNDPDNYEATVDPTTATIVSSTRKSDESKVEKQPTKTSSQAKAALKEIFDT